eukprot:1404706-Alexandrium_andersonii.AAC.1
MERNMGRMGRGAGHKSQAVAQAGRAHYLRTCRQEPRLAMCTGIVCLTSVCSGRSSEPSAHCPRA